MDVYVYVKKSFDCFLGMMGIPKTKTDDLK